MSDSVISKPWKAMDTLEGVLVGTNDETCAFLKVKRWSGEPMEPLLPIAEHIAESHNEIGKLRAELAQRTKERDEARQRGQEMKCDLLNMLDENTQALAKSERAEDQLAAEKSRAEAEYSRGFQEGYDSRQDEVADLAAQLAECREALAAGYLHLDTFGALSGGKDEETKSLERFFELYHKALAGVKGGA